MAFCRRIHSQSCHCSLDLGRFFFSHAGSLFQYLADFFLRHRLVGLFCKALSLFFQLLLRFDISQLSAFLFCFVLRFRFCRQSCFLLSSDLGSLLSRL